MTMHERGWKHTVRRQWSGQKARAFEQQGKNKKWETWGRIEAVLRQMRAPHES